MTFERWRAWLFEARDDSAMEWTEHEPRGAALAQYMIRLFEEAGTLVGTLTEAELATGTEELFGMTHPRFRELIDGGEVPADVQAQLYRAISSFYLDFLDIECQRYPDHDTENGESLAVTVFMIWDMCNVEYPTIFPERYPHLFGPCLDALERILMGSHSAACVKSALHGLGHADADDDFGGRARIASIIDAFLAARSDSFDVDVIEYAQLAREGRVL